jgi:aspartate aminotransferase
MNHLLSDRINNLATSQTLAMAALARELKAQGKDIISLSLGEPDFNTPDFIKEAAKSDRRKLQHLFSSRWIC